MRTILTIIRLFRRHPQNLAQKCNIKVQQKRSMEEQKMFTAPLRVARKFQIVEAKVSMTVNDDFGSRTLRLGLGVKRFNRRPVTFHDEPVGRGNVAKWTVFGNFQNKSVAKTTGTLHHGAAAGTAAINGNSICVASCHVDFGCHFIGIANNDKILGRFPKAKNFFTGAVFAPLEQHLVACEVFGGRGERQVEKSHFAVELISLALVAKLSFIVARILRDRNKWVTQ